MKKHRIFASTNKTEQMAHFGWQNKRLALYGLREGYKNSADDLVDIVISSDYNPRILDTYIFPIMFLYRHSLELSLKHIYQRCYDHLPNGGHDLLTLWATVKRDVIDRFITSEEFVMALKKQKDNFIKYSLEDISLNKIELLFKELQMANQTSTESTPQNKQVDQKAEVWRYLMDSSKEENLYFSCDHYIDYIELKKGVDYIYGVLDFIYSIVDDYFSE